MTQEQRMIYVLILVAKIKSFSEFSAYLQNELKFKQKQDFNVLIKHADRFIGTMESSLTDQEKEILAGISDEFLKVDEQIKSSL